MPTGPLSIFRNETSRNETSLPGKMPPPPQVFPVAGGRPGSAPLGLNHARSSFRRPRGELRVFTSPNPSHFFMKNQYRFLLSWVLGTLLVGTALRAAGQWSTATLGQGRSSLTAASVGNKVIFAGGNNGASSGFVDVYDTSTDTWSTTSLSKDRYELASAVAGGKAFFAGGYSDVGTTHRNEVDIYYSATNTWSTATLSVGRSYLTGTASGSKVFFAGGTSQAAVNSNVVDIYDVSTNTWSAATLSLGRFALAAASAGGKVFFAGGLGFDSFAFLGPGRVAGGYGLPRAHRE